MHVFICAQQALCNKTHMPYYPSYEDQDFVEWIRRMGGFDERIIENKRFFDLFMQPVYADYLILYKYNIIQKLPNIDITMMFSESDTPFEVLKDCKMMTYGKVNFLEYKGGYFSLKLMLRR